MMLVADDAIPDDIRVILAEVGARCQVGTTDATLVGRHSNIVIALPTARLLVRIAGNPDALDRVTASVTVTRWLHGRRYPCVPPADVEPFVIGGQVVSVWRLLDIADGPPGSGDELGRLLRVLHDQPHPPLGLRDLADPLASVARTIQRTSEGLTDQDRAWLLERIDQLRRAWSELTPARDHGLIHGDAHTNNLIRVRTGGIVLGDWDHVAQGPREWDLIQPHYMARRFGRHTERQLQDFTVAYGWDVRDWDGYDAMIELREISGLSPYIRRAPSERWARDEVAHRVATLRERNITARWNPPARRVLGVTPNEHGTPLA